MGGVDARPHRLRRRLILRFLAASLAIILLGPGCTPAPWYPEYFYPGTNDLVNLVSDLSFSADWKLDPTLRLLGETAALYLTFEEAADAGVAPPAVAAPQVVSTEVYRLELRSLIPGGDFTAAAAGAVSLGDVSAGWRYYPAAGLGGAGVHEILDAAHPYAITGKTLHFQTTTNTARLDFDLRDPVHGVTDGFLEDGSYLVRFTYRADDRPVILEFRDDISPVDNDTWLFYGSPDGRAPSVVTNVVVFPPESVQSEYTEIRPRGGPDYYLSFGSLVESASDIQNAYIDNVRLVRTDLLPRVELRLTYRLSLPIVGGDGSSEYALESGKYKFSVWVHDDPTVGTSPDRYRSSGIIVTVTAGDLGESAGSAVGTQTFMTVVTRGTDGWPGADAEGWARVSVETMGVQLARTVDPLAAVMVVTICPTDTTTAGGSLYDAGSILVSGPVLEFVSAGE